VSGSATEILYYSEDRALAEDDAEVELNSAVENEKTRDSMIFPPNSPSASSAAPFVIMPVRSAQLQYNTGFAL
jgi:hypothetical protein